MLLSSSHLIYSFVCVALSIADGFKPFTHRISVVLTNKKGKISNSRHSEPGREVSSPHNISFSSPPESTTALSEVQIGAARRS